MAGIIHKIEDALHIGGGNKEEDKNKQKHPEGPHPSKHPEQEYKHPVVEGQHHKEEGGFMEKVKDKIHGTGGEHPEEGHKEGEKKKKKDKKKKEGEHGHGHDGSSSSDSD